MAGNGGHFRFDPTRTSLPRESRAASGQSCTNGGAVKAKVSSYAMRGCRLSRRFLLCESCFQPRDVFLEALVVVQEALAGQDEEIVAELRILKVDFKQPFISYGQDLSVFYALDRHGSSVVRRKEAKFAHEVSWRKFDADFLDQKLSRDSKRHFGSRTVNSVKPPTWLSTVMVPPCCWATIS